MKKTYIIVLVLLVLIAGGALLFARSRQAEAPVPEMPITTIPPATPKTDVETKADTNKTPPAPVACTMEAKLCPDGSSVGRTGPKCEFAACPPIKVIPAVKEFTVSGKNFSFTPSVMKVKKGDTVRITFKNINGNHNLIIDEFNVNTGIINGGEQKTVEFTASKTGSFQYYCSVGTHRTMGMWGTLTVE